VTEREWLDAVDPESMLHFLQCSASERKLRLFACAACRHIWNMLTDEERCVVEIVERHADGLAKSEELQKAAQEMIRKELWEWGANYCVTGVRSLAATTTSAYHTAWATAAEVVAASGYTVRAARAAQVGYNRPAGLFPIGAAQLTAACKTAEKQACQAERIAQCALLRDIFHGACPPAHFSSHWWTWEDGTVTKIARSIYDEGRWGEVQVLADALEEAGCDDQQILGHLRGPGPHVKGCWVVDGLLGMW